VAPISTSGGKTARGKLGVGKLQKLRADMYFLLLADAGRRLMILTEADMFDVCKKEKQGGRIPDSIEFFLVGLPDELAERLNKAREVASGEVSPKP
jgi:hypothetical protein